MLYSKTCGYAIRALAYMARLGKGGAAQSREIARAEGMPAPVLRKILQQLVRKGLLHSRRGPGGGFRLGRDPELITLLDIAAVIDGPEHFQECAVGLERCADDAPCPLHHTWKGLRRNILAYLETTNVAEMAAAVTRKEQLLRPRGRRKK